MDAPALVDMPDGHHAAVRVHQDQGRHGRRQGRGAARAEGGRAEAEGRAEKTASRRRRAEPQPKRRGGRRKPEPAKAEKPKLPERKPEPPKKVEAKPEKPKPKPSPARPKQARLQCRSHRRAAEQDPGSRPKSRTRSMPPTRRAKTVRGQSNGTQMTMSVNEIDALRARIAQCWNPPPGGLGADAIIVKLRLQLNEDGSLVGYPSIANSGSSPFFQAAADSAVRAVFQCQPYALPSEKYAGLARHDPQFRPKPDVLAAARSMTTTSPSIDYDAPAGPRRHLRPVAPDRSAWLGTSRARGG